MAETKEFLGTGRRKTAVARVRLASGSGKIVVNGRPFESYFGLEALRTAASQPLTLTESTAKFDVHVNVVGGGPAGQAGAKTTGLLGKHPAGGGCLEGGRNSLLESAQEATLTSVATAA